MKVTFRCRCGTNLFVFEGENKIRCGVCGLLNIVPAVYWEDQPELVAELGEDYLSTRSNSENNEGIHWREETFFTRLFWCLAGCPSGAKPNWEKRLTTFLLVFIPALATGVTIQVLFHRAYQSEEALAYSNSAYESSIYSFKPADFPTELLDVKAYFDWAKSDIE